MCFREVDIVLVLFVLKRYAQRIARYSWRKHVYKPLNAAKQEIRILRLHPSKNLQDDPVCTLQTITIPGSVGFAALSYVWGDQSTHRYLILNRYRIEVGVNLHTALRYIRRPDRILSIWADAICINQQDLHERSAQVPLMRSIYWNAHLVCTWAGEANNDTGKSIRLLLGLLKLCESLAEKGARETIDTIVQDPRYIVQFDRIMRLSYCITSAELWHRLWIVQEIVMGMKRRTGFLLIGKHVVFMPRFLQIVNMLSMLHQKISALRNDEQSSEEIDYYESVLHVSALLSLSSPLGTDQIASGGLLLRLNHELDVSEPKDRVYGFLAMMPEINIVPRYELSVGEIYCDAAFKIARYCGNLDILQFVDPDQDDTDIPIWASGFRPLHPQGFSRRRDISLSWHQNTFINFDASLGAPFFLELHQNMLLVSGTRITGTKGLQQLGPIHLTKASVSDEDFIETMGLDSKDLTTDLVALVRCGIFVARAMSFWSENGLSSPIDRQACTRTIVFDTYPPGDKSSFANRRIKHYGESAELRLEEVHRSLSDLVQLTFGIIQGTLAESEEEYTSRPLIWSLVDFLETCFKEKRVALTACGRPCVVPGKTELGDGICIIPGSQLPWVLRPVEVDSSTAFRIIGTAYVDRCMDGEASTDGPRWTSTGNPDVYGLEWEQLALL
jgi:hypothetical protein